MQRSEGMVMAVTIKFELGDEDLEHFVTLAQEAQAAAVEQGLSPGTIVEGARQVFEVADRESTPRFIAERLRKLGTLVRMVDDAEWQLPEEDTERVLSAMCYFSNPDDLIPDRIPGVGFLDDAIMVDLMVENLSAEIASYNEFSAYRDAERARREKLGLSTDIGKEDWLAAKRSALQSKMRASRHDMLTAHRWRVTLWT